jgi:transposase
MGKKYDSEFKIEAVRIASEPGTTAGKVERDLGLSQGLISRWKRQLRQDGAEAFPGKGHLKAQDEQLRRLQRENERLRRERDILKKAVAIFSEDPNRYSGS